jgi:hypothetical protein
MNHDPYQAADESTVHANELEIAPDGTFDPVGDGARIPPAHRFGHQAYDLAAVPGRNADRGPAREAVELDLHAWIVALLLAQL